MTLNCNPRLIVPRPVPPLDKDGLCYGTLDDLTAWIIYAVERFTLEEKKRLRDGIAT